MSAERLREAARLMRERAAKAEPGRWKLWGMTVMADPKGTSNVDDAITVAHPVTPSTTNRLLHTGNADHIAAWNPVVALAASELLIAAYARLVAFPDTTDPLVTDAIKFADAYLGGTE